MIPMMAGSNTSDEVVPDMEVGYLLGWPTSSTSVLGRTEYESTGTSRREHFGQNK